MGPQATRPAGLAARIVRECSAELSGNRYLSLPSRSSRLGAMPAAFSHGCRAVGRVGASREPIGQSDVGGTSEELKAAV